MKIFFIILGLSFFIGVNVSADSVTCQSFKQCFFTECVTDTFQCTCEFGGASCVDVGSQCFDTSPSYWCPDDRCGECNPPPPPDPQCDDGNDNDGDGLTDYPADPGCTGFNDDNEFNITGPTTGSLFVNTNHGSANWCIDHGVGCGSGTSAFYDDLPFNTYTISVGGVSGYSCSSDVSSRQINSTNPDKGFTITCTATTPPASVDLRCNTLNSCTIPFNGTANLSWTTSNATSCTASNGWSGSKGTSGSEARPNLTSTQTFTLSCSGPGGSGQDSVVATVQPNTAPVASSVKAIEPDYCVVGPSITISWVYSDAEATAQTSVRIQIDNSASFTSPEYDSGKQSATCANGGTCSWNVPQGGALTWNTNYRARVMVWDSADTASAWATQTLCQGTPNGNPSGCAANQQSWTSPQHQYPSNITSFSWVPLRPPINQLVQFNIGSAQCFQNPPNTPTACARWDWTFGDGTGVDQIDPAHSYSTTGNYQVTLKLTEQQAGYFCSATKTLTVQGPIPNWKEVFPR